VTLKIRRDLSYCHDRCPQLRATDSKCRLFGGLAKFTLSSVRIPAGADVYERHVDCLAAMGEEEDE